MATATVVLICFDDPAQIKAKCHELTAWSRKPNQLIIMHTMEEWPRWMKLPNECRSMKTKVVYSANANDKGYRKCAEALEHVTSDYVCFVNYDDHHDFHFLEKLMDAVQENPYEVDVAHCRVAGKHGFNVGDKWEIGNSGRENNIIRTEYLRSIGGYEAAIELRKQQAPRSATEAIKADKALIGMTQSAVTVLVDEILVCML